MADVGVGSVGVARAFAARVHGAEADMLAVVDRPVAAVVDRLQDLQGEVALVDRQEAAGLGAEHRVSPPGPEAGPCAAIAAAAWVGVVLHADT